ncbi:MAG: tRNA 2-thiouridine(34) synthase MnmA [Clostridiales bacterium]|nr:tRNA 2-thiouridine(34) synthase MnmA [Clostridiales bacterium]
MKKTVLGLSGGVDSAAAGLLLLEMGYDVRGVYLDIGLPGRQDAEKTASQLEIELKTIDIRDELEEHVCRRFTEEYLRGRTPNPCIMCNPKVKFKALFDAADALGCDCVATGHYARVKDNCLMKSSGDAGNDQSYMLCRLPREYISQLILPLGELSGKGEVREYAAKHGLSCASKPDSMEICFIPDNDYPKYIESQVGVLPEGDFIDENGKILGRHKGIHRYTVGMRRGLGIAMGERMFVSKIDREHNTVILSKGESVFKSSLSAASAVVLSPNPPEIGKIYDIKVRHSVTFAKGLLRSFDGEKFWIDFPEPVRAPAPGQSAVLYDGDVLVLSGYIEDI